MKPVCHVKLLFNYSPFDEKIAIEFLAEKQ
jgi:hypothetical protein